MTVVQNTVTDPGNEALALQNVRIALMTGSPSLPGYTGTSSILGTLIATTTQAGLWSATLTPNSAITPANTYYQVTEPGGGISNIVVPASGGPYELASLLVTPPPTPAGVGITGVQVAAGGTVAGVRPEVNLVAGTGVSVAGADNPGANRVDVTVAANIGTTAGTVAAGNDTRITGAAQTANNLSDLTSAPTARMNLGLGSAATENVGTTAGTVAAGNDGRITGALQAASNLGDLASATTARTNLGLGTAATQPATAFDAAGAASTAQTNAQNFATTAVNAETTRAEAAEALLAPLANPALTGSPTAPTQTAGDNTTKIATDAFVTTAVAAETTRAEAAESARLPLSGGTMSGAIAMGSNKVTGLTNGSAASDAATFGQIPTSAATIGGLLTANALSELAAVGATARGNISAAKSGANSDITSLAGLTSPLPAVDISAMTGAGYAVDVGGDAINLSGVSTTNGSHTVTCSTANFQPTDVGKTYVDYTLSGGVLTVTTIATWVSSTQITTTAAMTGTSSAHHAVYGTDATSRVNALLAANRTVVISGNVLFTNTITVPSNCEVRGGSMGANVYAAHSNNIFQSSSWGVPYTNQDTCPGVEDMQITMLGVGTYLTTTLTSGGSQSYGIQLNVTSSAGFVPGQIVVNVSGTNTNCWTSGSNGSTKLGQVICPTGALSIPVGSTVAQGGTSTTTTGGTQVTAGAVSLPVLSTTGWPAASLTAPVYFFHAGNVYGYVSATPFASCFYADPSVSSAQTYINHGLCTPLNSQGHGVAFQGFRAKIDRIWTHTTIGDGIIVQGSGNQDPIVYGPHITRCRTDNAGWIGLEIGNWATDGYMDMITVNASGEAQMLIESGDWSIGTVHLVCQAITPQSPALVVCASNTDIKELIIDTCVGPGIIIDGGGRYKAPSVAFLTIHSVRTVQSGSTLGQFGFGELVLTKTRAATVVHSNLLIEGCNWTNATGWLVTDGANTKTANQPAQTLSTTASTQPVMDASGFDQLGGTFTLDTQTVTYTGATYNTGQSAGNATLTIGTGSDGKTGTISLSPALPAAPVDGDWYVVGGLALVQCNGASSTASSFVFKQSMWLPWSGASGTTLKVFSNSIVSRQTLTGCTIASGTQSVNLGDACQQASMALGTSTGEFASGLMSGIGFGRSNLATGSSWSASDACKFGMGVTVTSGTVSASPPQPLSSRGQVTITNPATSANYAHGLAMQTGQTLVATTTPTSNAATSGREWVTVPDLVNVTVNVATTPSASTTYNVTAAVPF